MRDPEPRCEVLVISRDRVGSSMAGPGVRAFEVARTLADRHSVRLAGPLGSEAPAPEVPFAEFDLTRPASLEPLLAGVDVVISEPLPISLVRRLADGRRRWIADLYVPEPFEGIESQRRHSSAGQRFLDRARIERLLFCARSASAFVCASERQRDMWLGFLAAAGRVTTASYRSDPEARDLIDVLRFGIPADPPVAGPPLLRGELFPQDSRIVVWSGGLWDWLDPLTVLRAVAQLREDDQRWRCAFVGVARPAGFDHMTMPRRTRELAEALGLIEQGAVEMIDWIPYRRRATPLLEADVAVCAHRPTLETRFSFRTRLLDAVWTQLPIVCTEGDGWSEEIAERGLGEIARPGDPAALAAALARAADGGRERYRPGLTALAEGLRWPEVVGPLLRMLERSQRLDPARIPLRALPLAPRSAALELRQRLRRRRARAPR